MSGGPYCDQCHRAYRACACGNAPVYVGSSTPLENDAFQEERARQLDRLESSARSALAVAAGLDLVSRCIANAASAARQREKQALHAECVSQPDRACQVVDVGRLERELHIRLKRLLGKRQQGHVMGAFREALAQSIKEE